MKERTTLKTSEIAAELRVVPSTVREWIRKGFLPAIKVGRTIRVYADDFRVATDATHGKDEK